MDKNTKIDIDIQESKNLVEIDISNRIATSLERFGKMPAIKKKVGIIRMWPNQAVAEHENIERFRVAFSMLGVEIVELDRYGFILDSDNKTITPDDVDFVIHLHFETGKVYDAVSVAAMWNPVQFYVDWGFNKFWSNQISHDVFAYTGAKEIKSMLKTSLGDFEEYKMPILNHTLASPIYKPQAKKEYKAFYCGINWEKISGKKGRHDEVLKALDKKRIINIFGPEKIMEKKVWDGFNGYQGSLPFDGKEVIKQISKAGACLVLSSDAHISTNIMSNRLFEALAAGAIVIGDEHSFISETIGNNYIKIPSWLSAEERVKIIEDAFKEFNANPEKAVEMATKSQAVFLDKFLLCNQLVDLYSSVVEFKKDELKHISKAKNNEIDIVIQPEPKKIDYISERILKLTQKLGAKANIFVITNDEEFEDYGAKLKGAASVLEKGSNAKETLSPNQCIEILGTKAKSSKICFWRGTEDIFINSFLGALVDLKDVNVAGLGFGIKHFTPDGDAHIDFQTPSANAELLHESSQSAIIFDRKWVNDNAYSKMLEWRDIAKISQYNNDEIYSYAKTCIIIDLKSFEEEYYRNEEKRIKPEIRDAIVKNLIRTKKSNTHCVQISRIDKETTDFTQLSPQIVVEKIKNLSPEQKWDVTLSLYKSVPMPYWMRSFVTFVRKLVGVR